MPREAEPGATGNRLLDLLPASALSRLEPGLRLIDFRAGDVLHAEGSPDRMAHFPVRGVAVQTFRASSGGTVATTIAGAEGMLNLLGWLSGGPALGEWLGLISGQAWRARIDLLGEEADLLLRSVAAGRICELGQSAACHQLHLVEERTARWLLEVAERTHLEELELTHELLAAVVGVPRTRITSALQHLEATAAIHRGRAKILIRDPERLLADACECYAVVREAHESLGIPRDRPWWLVRGR
jgi:hypothetical protein